MNRILSMLAASLFAFVPAFAHDAPSGMKYDAFCCNGDNHTGDCQPITARSVKVTSAGYVVTLGPGDHRLVTVSHRYVVPFADARASTDGEYHACLYPTEDTLRCFYAPPMSY